MTTATPGRALKLVIAFAIVYLVWGSTYLAIRVMVGALPPWSAAGVRMLSAGVLLSIVAVFLGHKWPAQRRDWAILLLCSVAMLVLGNGVVTWSEQWIPSGQAALIVATSALWMAIFGSLGSAGESISLRAWIGLILGFVGVAALVHSDMVDPDSHAPMLAYLGLIAAPIGWAFGSVFLRRNAVKASALVIAAIQMALAGLLMLLIGLLLGEPAQWRFDEPSALWALAYLIVFGSCIAYGAYAWLAHEVSPALLGTYAYVNPAVAVVLGAMLLDESLNRSQWIGTAVIVVSVLLVTVRRLPFRKAAG